MAECAYVVCPSLLPPEMANPQVRKVFETASNLYKETGVRMLFFSDLTKHLDTKGSDWSGLGVDWELAVKRIEQAPTPGLYLTLSHRAHVILSDASREGAILHFPDGHTEQITPSEREMFRDGLVEQLNRDWPPYMQRLLAERGRTS